MWKKFKRKYLDGILGDSQEVAGFSGEVALVKRLTYCVECIGYPQSGYINNLSSSSFSLFFHLDFLWQRGASSQYE